MPTANFYALPTAFPLELPKAITKTACFLVNPLLYQILGVHVSLLPFLRFLQRSAVELSRAPTPFTHPSAFSSSSYVTSVLSLPAQFYSRISVNFPPIYRFLLTKPRSTSEVLQMFLPLAYPMS